MSSKKAKSNQGNGKQDKGRFSSKRKTEVVLRLLRGEDLEASREAVSRLKEGRPLAPGRSSS
ncbi:hypothetical protein LRD18_12620 [Halorhodospira halochloris]|uniref:hypothetical protein n=1 Tax=Halorhodospira halochloris TaxID=1052 RepID=UPI001EE967A4|nr:hypothetical protein [Halorhodospira halochloris]MCG5531680.1 hypothetical protein [Halorhodospira halochloris]MCG5548204.1 hypothetical protein [Halorhodospira halochloris]